MNKNLPITYPAVGLPSKGSLESFISWCYSLPVLDAKEERRLASRYHDHDDLEAAHKLIIHNMRFVVHIARGYGGYGLALSDLIQEGSVGLMKAVKRFDPKIKVRLISFAVYWVRAEIHEFVLKNWRIVKVATTKAQRTLFFNLRKMKKRVAWLNNKEVEEISRQLKVKPEEVLEMERRMSSYDVSFDPVSDSSSEEEKEIDFAPAEYLPACSDHAKEFEEEQWKTEQYQGVSDALEKLDPRSLDIIKRRWLASKKATLHELAKEYSISAERIRQIEDKALKQLHATVTN